MRLGKGGSRGRVQRLSLPWMPLAIRKDTVNGYPSTNARPPFSASVGSKGVIGKSSSCRIFCLVPALCNTTWLGSVMWVNVQGTVECSRPADELSGVNWSN